MSPKTDNKTSSSQQKSRRTFRVCDPAMSDTGAPGIPWVLAPLGGTVLSPLKISEREKHIDISYTPHTETPENGETDVEGKITVPLGGILMASRWATIS